jgi:alanine-synthesizing transaminase
MSDTDQFYRIAKLPPYVFAVINEMKAKMRAAGKDVVDFGMGNPDGSTPQVVIDKLCEAAQQAKNHRYSMSRGIPQLRLESATSATTAWNSIRKPKPSLRLGLKTP